MFLFPSLFFLLPWLCSPLFDLVANSFLFIYIFFGGCCLSILKKNRGWKTKIVLGGGGGLYVVTHG